MDPETEMDGLRGFNPQAALTRDGGRVGVLLPSSQLNTPSSVEVMDLLLLPAGDGSYTTRLLLERQVGGKSNLNWTTVMFLGRMWHTWSWQNVPSNQPWIKILAEHARQLR